MLCGNEELILIAMSVVISFVLFNVGFFYGDIGVIAFAYSKSVNRYINSSLVAIIVWKKM